MYILLFAIFITTILASAIQPRHDAAAQATCETHTHSFNKDILVYLFAQTHCTGWTSQKLIPTRELKEHPNEDTAACYATNIDVKSCWYPNDVVKDFGCRILPNCEGNVLTIPAYNADAIWAMRDFSRFPLGWNGRTKSLKCFKM
ncbi:hypothetical protein P171DRAFT_516027 [Karstenula rhodostoma CBS 690.94]|uniref:Secreted protein n=1 Tax=Karstenula rhodostoma CBS 690.94 TaxID=1392251 RepID=A0A9P4PXP4_9PLEO|nr:hypothetical protein P171DRAFT_516027 [Karstenula rhodostoma CBS 690.94]